MKSTLRQYAGFYVIAGQLFEEKKTGEKTEHGSHAAEPERSEQLRAFFPIDTEDKEQDKIGAPGADENQECVEPCCSVECVGDELDEEGEDDAANSEYFNVFDYESMTT